MGIFRLLLAICVLFHHAGASLGGIHWLSGGLAVEVFFVLSGFYMQMILSEKYSRQTLGKYWYLRFYSSRYSRLLPTYLVCLSLTVPAAIFASYANHKVFPPISIWTEMASLNSYPQNIALWLGAIFANLTMFFQEWVSVLAVQNGVAVFTLNRGDSDFPVWFALALPHGWSLGVELSFYFFAPALLKLSNKKFLLLLLISLVAKTSAIELLGGDLYIRLIPFIIFNFLAGAFAYRIKEFIRYPAWIAYIMLFVIIAVLPSFFDEEVLSWIAIFITVFVVSVAFEATKNSTFDSRIGELSYPFYVFHLLCLAIASFTLQRMGILTKGIELAITSLILTLLVSTIMFKLQSKFIDPWRKRFSKLSNGPKKMRHNSSDR